MLTNTKIADATEVNLDIPDFSAVEMPEPPRLVPTLAEVGEIKTSSGFENMNAQHFFTPEPRHRVSDEHLMKEKYEILRKFDRLSRMGVPMRKRFTLESPIEEMKTELEFIRKEKAMDQTIKQFCDWYITGMSAMEWGSKNIAMMKAFGLNLQGLSESAQMNVGDMEEDFEELYDLYGDKMTMHPLVRIPIRTCMMVYMVHLTNQMAMKSPVPNMEQILKTNPDIARQLATASMQQQSQSMRQPSSAPPMAPPSNPLAGLSNFMSGMVPPPPQQTNVRPPSIKPIKLSNPVIRPTTPAPPPPVREMSAPPSNIADLLKSVDVKPAIKKGGSTGKNSVTIKL
jgi:hypothetical protein